MKIGTRIFLLSIVNVLILLGITAAVVLTSVIQLSSQSVERLESTMRQDFDNLAKNEVQAAISIISGYNAKAESGEITTEEAKKMAADAIRDLRYGKDGYFWIDTTKGVSVVLPTDKDKKIEGTNRYDSMDSKGNYFVHDFITNGMKEDGGYTDYWFKKIDSDKQFPKRSYTMQFEPFGWVVGTGNYTDYIDEQVLQQQQVLKDHLNSSILLIVVLLLVSLAVSSLVSIFFGRRISKPIKVAADNLHIISTGDLSTIMPEHFKKAKGEIGILSRAVDTMQESVKKLIKGVVDESKTVEDVVTGVSSNMDELNRHFEEVSAITEELSAGMEETAASTQEMNATASEINEAVESIAVKAQEGAASAHKISKNASDLNDNFKEAQRSSLNIFVDVKQKLEAALQESKEVEKVNTLTSAILQITEQTNLLALNAAIEAARAGEAGKGFAVVAEEIRKLAEDSKKTATEIRNITKTVVQSVDNLSTNANNLLSFMSTDVDSDYRTMLKATEEYKKDAENISILINDFSMTVEEVSASMKNMVKAINEVTEAAGDGANGTSNIAQKAALVVEKSCEVLEYVGNSKASVDKLRQMAQIFRI